MTALACLWMVAVPAAAQTNVDPGRSKDGIDHGATGTLNNDYFAAVQNPGTHHHWLVGDGEKYHLEPALTDIRLGNYEKARADLDFLLVRFINHPGALEAMVTLAGLMRRPLAVLPYFENAIAIYPQYALTHAQYGRYLGKVGRHESAVAMLKRAIEMEPTLAVAHAWLGVVYAKMGQGNLAREAAERAKQLGYSGTLQVGR